MNILITGGNTPLHKIADALLHHVEPGTGPVTIITDGHTPASRAALLHAKRKGYDTITYTPDWDTYGKDAGPYCNQEMIDDQPDMCIAFPTATSRLTNDLINRANAAGIPTHIH